jgi:hypothetical protein
LSVGVEEELKPKVVETHALFMEPYLLDAKHTRNMFTGLGLSWHISEFSVHVYFSVLWKNEYKKSYTAIYDGFLARVYSLIFKKNYLRFSYAARKVISRIGHWYLEERSTYLRIFGATGAPHLLPAHVSNRLVLGEICYHTILQGFNASLVKDKKRAFIPYGLYVGYHFVKETTHARQEAQNQVEYNFYIGIYRKHDPNNLVTQHINRVVSHWSFAHDIFEDEIFTENALDWEELLQRKEKTDLT